MLVFIGSVTRLDYIHTCDIEIFVWDANYSNGRVHSVNILGNITGQ